MKRLAAALLAAALSAASLGVLGQERKDMVLRDDARCTRCHNEGDEYPVLAIAKTKHGTRADARTPTCTSCHGVSETHVNRPPDAKVRPKPERTFGKGSQTPVAERNGACLACHQGGKRIHWQMSEHAARDVACASCHDVHTQHDKARDKATQTEVCFSCHKEIRAQVSRPSRHPIKEGKVACSDCHNPHGGAGSKMLVRDTVNDTCYSCHMEKRGPFVRTHAPVQENCALCHNPHGTTNDNLLRQRAPFLCQQCHEPTSHRGNPGMFGAFTSGTGTNLHARGCVNCHTNIHGTNNVVNDAPDRSLRR